MISGLDFTLFVVAVDKTICNNYYSFNTYPYHISMRIIMEMITNTLIKGNQIEEINCESRSKNQNKDLQDAYSLYLSFGTSEFGNTKNHQKMTSCFPTSLNFLPKDPYLFESSGLELADLTPYPHHRYQQIKSEKEFESLMKYKKNLAYIITLQKTIKIALYPPQIDRERYYTQNRKPPT
jgi:hypothetical protein